MDTSDLYVLIVGHRYGFQPSDDNPEGLSITQLEFRRAGQSDIPRVALLRTSIPDVSLSDLADPQRLALVSAFREEVTRAVRPAQFSDQEGLIQGLSTGVQAELDKLDTRSPAGRGAGRRAAGPVLRLAPRPVFLAGREELLAALGTRLSAGDDRWPRVVALCGLGGAGKTSVAVEYAHRHLAETDLAWQFPAEDPTVLTDDFARLAAQLGARELLEARDPVASVHAVLAASPAGWLLVFDNAPDQASVQRFLPPAGHGRVLVTSQSALWPPGQGLEVPVLDVQVAAGFLVNRTGDPDGQAAAELAGELGGLPLALEQAAAFIQSTGDDLAGYLELFRQQRAGLLGRGEPDGVRQDGRDDLGAGVWPAGAGRAGRGRAAAADGVLRARGGPAAPAAAAPPRAGRHTRPGRGAGAGAAAGQSAGRRGCGRGAAPVFAGHPGRGRAGVGAPAGAGRHHRSDARRSGRAMAAGCRRVDRGRDTRRYQSAADLARLRRAAAACPGGPCR